MNWRHAALALLLCLASGGRAEAEELETFCVDRPGLGTPDCTMDAGHAAVELGFVDWTRASADGLQSDTLVFGDLLVRYGLSSNLEAQIGWYGLALDRERDSAVVSHETSAGDVRLAFRYRFGDPDGLSAAVMPFVTLPIGDDSSGTNDWSTGLILPVEYALPHNLEFDFTGEIDVAADAQGSGHHLAYSGTIGLGLPLGERLIAAVELQASRDDDPIDDTDQVLGGLSLGWTLSGSLQLDAGAAIGLGRHDPDVELYAGIARRF